MLAATWHSVCIHQINRVNSHNGFKLWWQHHIHHLDCDKQWLWRLLLLGMHQISGSGLLDIWPFLICGSGSSYKLPDNEPVIYLFITKSCSCHVGKLQFVNKQWISVKKDEWNRKSSSIWQFFTIDLNNNNVTICIFNITIQSTIVWGMKCIAVHYQVPNNY